MKVAAYIGDCEETFFLGFRNLLGGTYVYKDKTTRGVGSYLHRATDRQLLTPSSYDRSLY